MLRMRGMSMCRCTLIACVLIAVCLMCECVTGMVDSCTWWQDSELQTNIWDIFYSGSYYLFSHKSTATGIDWCTWHRCDKHLWDFVRRVVQQAMCQHSVSKMFGWSHILSFIVVVAVVNVVVHLLIVARTIKTTRGQKRCGRCLYRWCVC